MTFCDMYPFNWYWCLVPSSQPFQMKCMIYFGLWYIQFTLHDLNMGIIDGTVFLLWQAVIFIVWINAFQLNTCQWRFVIPQLINIDVEYLPAHNFKWITCILYNFDYDMFNSPYVTLTCKLLMARRFYYCMQWFL